MSNVILDIGYIDMFICIFMSCVYTHLSIYIKHTNIHRYVPKLCPLKWPDTFNEQSRGRGAEMWISYIQVGW